MYNSQKTKFSLVATSLLVASITLFGAMSAAHATSQGEAIKLCAKNPSCGLARSPGGVGMWVDNGKGGSSEIWCPDKGPCEVIINVAGRVADLGLRGILVGKFSHAGENGGNAQAGGNGGGQPEDQK
jgi:hypothetical protein